TDDDVGLKAEPLQAGGGARHRLGATRRGLELLDGPVRVRRRRVGAPVGHLAHAGDLVGVGLGDEDDLVLPRRDEMADEVQELAGEILVDEKEPHAGARDVEKTGTKNTEY